MPVPPDSSSASAPSTPAESTSAASAVPASPALLLQVKETRYALLTLHKKLLDAERVRYERVNGRVPGPGALLQLVLNDPWFAWLRPISTLVVQIDERMDSDAPVQAREAESILTQARAVVEANGGVAESAADAGSDAPAARGSSADAPTDTGTDTEVNAHTDASQPAAGETSTTRAPGFHAKYRPVAAESAEVRQAYATLLARLDGSA